MKKVFVLTSVILSLSLAPIRAQESCSTFGLGLQSNLVSIPLSPQNHSSESSGVYLFFMPSTKIILRAGFDNRKDSELKLKQFESSFGAHVGLGYVVYENAPGNFSAELSASFTNSLKEFKQFSNYHSDLGIKFLSFKAFYIGTGVRYSHIEKTNFSISPLSITNWYWNIGLQLQLTKKK
jgi:hypothetical protein